MSDTLEALRLRYAAAETFTVYYGFQLCPRLFTFVRDSQKTATSGALHDLQNGEPMPEPRCRDIILH
jgi:hypothetical protein